MRKSASYLLDVGEAAASRLALLDEAYGPLTHAFLTAAGLRAGMTALDVGCGTGSVALWMAERVGPAGRVVGVDSSPEQLAVARSRAAGLGLANVEFLPLAAEELDFLDRRFDLVFARFLLVHVPQPARVLRAMLDRVRPGGTLACDEQELAAASCMPPASAFTSSIELAYRASRARGLDYDYGRQIYRLFGEFGCIGIDLRVAQPALTSPAAKRLWPLFFVESGPGMLAAGLVAQEELTAMVDGLDTLAADERAFILPMRNHQAFGRRPG